MDIEQQIDKQEQKRKKQLIILLKSLLVAVSIFIVYVITDIAGVFAHSLEHASAKSLGIMLGIIVVTAIVIAKSIHKPVLLIIRASIAFTVLLVFATLLQEPLKEALNYDRKEILENERPNDKYIRRTFTTRQPNRAAGRSKDRKN
ncbi:MAG: hypothetical protein GC137_10935 [Alphaproteobacteria bacterium]|nr:hypothetical protein [Alphaproteobacteria bacterium]